MPHDPKTRVDRQPLHRARFCDAHFQEYLALGGQRGRWERKATKHLKCGRVECPRPSMWVEARSINEEVAKQEALGKQIEPEAALALVSLSEHNAAVLLGRLGGLRRAKVLSFERRQAIGRLANAARKVPAGQRRAQALKAARARWGKRKGV